MSPCDTVATRNGAFLFLVLDLASQWWGEYQPTFLALFYVVFELGFDVLTL